MAGSMVVLPSASPVNLNEWEFCWAPYDLPTYQLVLNQLLSNDIILEIGAGDLRLARQMAVLTRKVYAIEINSSVLTEGLASFAPLPGNLIPICADARAFDYPLGITTGVLLMRHCTHFQLYAEKLRDCGCRRLISNARWGMNVEVVDLQAARIPFTKVNFGWYACWCGAVGFKPGAPEQISLETQAVIHEVLDCPNCKQNNFLISKFNMELSV
jgi:hypothetical protein